DVLIIFLIWVSKLRSESSMTPRFLAWCLVLSASVFKCADSFSLMQHLDSPGTNARMLFLDFSSAFNTIIPEVLITKLTQLTVPASTCQWITNVLIDRKQQVRLGEITSST